uniref:Uncharacterized protein n=1 Tax=Acrobeloides nanus TaxID=290746 RepID=A0A914D359_9BILA
MPKAERCMRLLKMRGTLQAIAIEAKGYAPQEITQNTRSSAAGNHAKRCLKAERRRQSLETQGRTLHEITQNVELKAERRRQSLGTRGEIEGINEKREVEWRRKGDDRARA